MTLPLVAVVGRPNVGKSTFVNRVVGAKSAIVHHMRGVTRDRSYHTAEWAGVAFRLVDTGGIEMTDDDEFQASIRAQAIAGVSEADVVVFLVDVTCGVSADDEEVASLLKRQKKPTFLAVNKVDNPQDESALWDFMSLGLGQPWPISSAHGHGTGDLLDAVVQKLKSIDAPAQTQSENNINVAIIGRPNAGKSSLTNCLTNNTRSIVSDVAGTTRDAIDTVVQHGGKTYTIVDTAGLRHKSKIDKSVEYYSFVRAMRAIERAQVAILVIDGSIGLTDQDQRIAGFAAERQCALIIVLNKWDLVKGPDEKAKVRSLIADRMTFVSYAQVLATVALTGKSVVKIWDLINSAYENYCKKIPTNKLNAWLTNIRESGHTVSKAKVVLRMKYVTQTGTCPPQFTFFVNRPDVVTTNYERFLENRLRKEFNLQGTPVNFKFKKKD